MNEEFPELESYVLSHACPMCNAPAWVECNIATADSAPHHRTRLALGLDHRSSDVANDEDTLPSPHVTDVQTEGLRIIELLDTAPLPAGVVTDVSGQTTRGGSGLQVRKTVIDGKLIDMNPERI